MTSLLVSEKIDFQKSYSDITEAPCEGLNIPCGDPPHDPQDLTFHFHAQAGLCDMRFNVLLASHFLALYPLHELGKLSLGRSMTSLSVAAKQLWPHYMALTLIFPASTSSNRH